LQITNSTQVTLDYEVKVGPSGIGSVELYLTKDEGQTWERYADVQAEDPKIKPALTVNLPGDGIYGLRIVVGSRTGLGRRIPRNGDAPQMRVQVITTKPVAQLFPPQPEPNRGDAVVITWSAHHRYLAPNPITLLWADRPNGNWQMVKADLPNTGRYVWTLPANLPAQVYLHLVVRDMAGNEGHSELPEPIDLQEPEGEIKGIIKTSRQP
jgi:hypothetical protein